MSTEELLQQAHLRYVADTIPGFHRKRTNDSFTYIDIDGKVITDEKVFDRIAKLVIPPAWENVWICPYENGHLQATGYDQKKRKQYRYHELWTEISQQKKFEHMLEFANVLPIIRRKVQNTMQQKMLSREKVLATIVWLLENTLIRVGNEEYEKENKSYGLTTLKNKHVEVRGDEVSFAFKGKSGVYHNVSIHSKKVARIIKECQEIPGQDLFEYIDENKNRQVISSQDVNQYLKDISGKDITAKDFRTWAGTILAAKMLDKIGCEQSKTGVKKNITTAVKKVAQHLRNKPSTSRKYYIHPIVFDAYTNGYVLSNLNTHKKFNKSLIHESLREEENGIIALISLFNQSP